MNNKWLALTLTLGAGLGICATGYTEDWHMWGGSPNRIMANETEKNLPKEWDVKSGKNVKWKAQLGSQSYGNPVIGSGKVIIGTNNELELNPAAKGDKGVVMCFDEKTGAFLWEAIHDKLESGRVNDWPQQGICSSAFIEGNRAYYVSNRCQLVCVDLEGFHDNKENDGPFVDEKLKGETDADFIWILDMMKELDVFPHNMATSSPVVVGDIVFIVTGNGVDEGHIEIPHPKAPSFIAVDKNTGKVLWKDGSPGEKILHGQWSAPAVAEIGGVLQAIFPGGDGFCYGFDAKTGEKLWWYNLNPKDSFYELGGGGTKSDIISTPVIFENTILLSTGQDPEHGEGVGNMHRIDPTKRGDITDTGRVWRSADVKRTMSTPAIHDGIIYMCDLGGYFRAMDAATGKTLWDHDLLAAVWGSPYYVDGKVFIGDEDGDVAIFQAGKEKKLLGEIEMDDSVYSTPVAANGTLYIMNRTELFALAEGAQLKAEAKPAK